MLTAVGLLGLLFTTLGVGAWVATQADDEDFR